MNKSQMCVGSIIVLIKMSKYTNILSNHVQMKGRCIKDLILVTPAPGLLNEPIIKPLVVIHISVSVEMLVI